MYSVLYDRICGWLCVAAAVTGWVWGGVSHFMAITPAERLIYAAAGSLMILAARGRPRYAVLCALWLGMGIFLWGLAGLAGLNANGVFRTTEPLENALRFVAGGWGMVAAVEDALAWRRKTA
ncbi:hypothetical protein GCM10010885_09030 [Alicyclobacillus cellulosilyticus]|uniref:Uncharacterized protein n=1 Tax=Alicyclobacillus cellulosilyticus TaxID=1003997 RepID=A0A917K8W0_9BACL|nr:hypothetical protein [Alicyclobacillus cellulosilyticus]GGJ01978.1 hypothetical protein GCM10010885_09030 [Alicyclobacillus cellulosilyticus]